MLVTFCVISYNQEDTILETLESIDYQVSKYGNNKEIQLIISDDGSQDKTFILEKIWIESNRNKFTEIKLLPSDNNRGLVANLLRSYMYIRGDYYKVIAGDDLLADSDFLSKLDNKDFYIFGNFVFQNYTAYPMIHQYRQYCFWGSSFEQLRNISKFVYPFTAQSWFCSSKLNVRGLNYELKKYKYLDDQTAWNYWLKNLELRFEYVNIPLVLYRLSEKGISNQNNLFHQAVLEDLFKLREDMTRDLHNPLEKYIAKMYELRIKHHNDCMLRIFYTLINPHEYLTRMKIIRKRNKMKALAYELDNKFLQKNQLYLETIHKRAKTLYGNMALSCKL